MSIPKTMLPRPTELADIVSRLVHRPQEWMDHVRLIRGKRASERPASRGAPLWN
jgi:hypothetical protein